jgi:CheY-like chemotaxis protein
MSACPGVKTNTKILVVDDDKNAIKLLKLNLEAYGFTVLTAISGRNGLDQAFSELPEAIILDVRMPDLNGWQVCERLKNEPRTQAIPVIFLTAYSQKTDFEKSKKLRADLFLNKPLDPEKLAQKIRGVLGGNDKDLSGEEKERL